MSLYEEWIKAAYDHTGQTNKKYWSGYMTLEKQVYEDLLEDGSGTIKMPMKDFAKKYGLSLPQAVGFIDGISGALTLPDGEEIAPSDISEDYEIDFKFEFDVLFKKMVEYKAKHLYLLPGWKKYFDEETQGRMIDEQRRSGIVIVGEKLGRNDPCLCGSGKKYKQCCIQGNV